MTTPIISPTSIFAPPPPPEAEVTFPLGWLLDNASPPIQYRATNEVAKLGGGAEFAAGLLPMAYRPALELAVQADVNGVWNDSMLALPSQRAEHFEGIGTIPAMRRLLEYGWDKDAPPLLHTKRVLFRLLAEDNDPDFLYELRPSRGKVEEEVLQANRQLLREAAGAALASAGFEADPRLRGLARRTIERIAEFVRSPLAEKPWIRVGNKQVLHPDAYPPSIYALHLIANMPLFQNEHYEAMELLNAYLARPLPRQESVQQVGTTLMPVPYAVLGDLLPHRNAVENDVPKALAWLELMARMGFLRRNEVWTKMFERFVDDCGRDGVWHPHKGMAMPKSTDPYVWPMFPLEVTHGGEERWCDVTFRVGLIARLSGRPISIV
ncbi:MAG TPA: hypothetical protein PK788_07410 [Gemmatimonadaceae bacterium]|nr:hypothetical protein [Gemmatimonadaceae bacterium]